MTSSSEAPPPQLLVEISLPEICSYSTPEAPELRGVLTLQASRPVTIISRGGATFWPIQNALMITDAKTGEKQRLPNVDVCYRQGPDLALTQAHEQAYLTLEPGKAHVIAQPFRPFRRDEINQENKYRLMRFGMHQFTIGVEYIIRLEPGLSIDWWKYGTKEELLVPDGEEPKAGRASDGDPMLVVEKGEARFRVGE